jgi:hypothetical protein
VTFEGKDKEYHGFYIRPGSTCYHYVGVKKAQKCAGWWVKLEQIKRRRR